MTEFSLPKPPLADFPTACTQMHDHDPDDCAPETYTDATVVDIHTDTNVIGRAIQIIGEVQQGLADHAKRKSVITELQRAVEILGGMNGRPGRRRRRSAHPP